ncbi:hypothetical protein Agub_g4061 [Astrephomene gubernaculifera]|uniref:RING-type domain-containing protein n=1 Tax=Astrephomene gubernaculifera TaxID=47775 RepID=A0AAD3HJW5_9CHLO|nr:hypothetical protein Agub_g4061 [Astrephomene gubernaculifera]
MVDPSQFDCAICQNLLLDPVVGPCGHDFCQSCLGRWRTASTRSSVLTCPLCREPIPSALGICVRLRETIQLLFPDKVRERRAEEERKVALTSAANTVGQASASSTSQRASNSFRTPPSVTAGQGFSQLLHSLRGSGRHTFRHAAATATAASSTPAGAPGPATETVPTGAQPFSSTWVPPATLCFTLGWHDPAETRFGRRRSMGRRRRVRAA